MIADAPVLAVAHQIGSGRAIAPVIQALQARKQPVVVVSCGLAAAAFEREHIEFSRFDPTSETMTQRAAEVIDSVGPAAILSGTSAGVTFEKILIETAKRRGVPTIAVLDHWSNYLLRFAGPNGIDHYFPLVLAVMDQTARHDLLALGYRDDAVAVTGQPAFDALTDFDERNRQAVRGRLGVLDEERLVVFASEPLRRDHGDALGFDEIDALRMFLDIAAELPGPRLRVVIKPHPTEATETLSAVAAQSPVRPLVVPNIAPKDLVLAADVVVGMTSVILLESALVGTPVVSLQPNLRVEDQFIGKRLGVVDAVYDRQACRAALVRLLNGNDRQLTASCARSALGVDGGAAARVADLIETMIRRDAMRTVQSQLS